MSSTSRERAGGRAVWFVVLGLLLLAGLAYAAAYAAAGDRVPRGTTVSGVKIGGMTEREAEQALREGLADDAIQFTVDGSPGSVSPASAGLSVDYAASVAQAGARRSWDPAWLWDWATGGDDLDAVVEVDQPTLDGFLDRVDAERGQAPVDGTVGFRHGNVKVGDPVTGSALDRETAQAVLAEALVSGEPATLEMAALEPDIDADDVAVAVRTFANPAVSDSVAILFGDAKVRLTPEQYTPALTLEPVDGTLRPTLDERELKRLLDEQVPPQGAAVDATVRLVAGTPRVIPGKPGVGYDVQDVLDQFLDVVARPSGSRTLEVEATVEKPAFTTKDARALKIKERVSTFTTYYPHADYRNTNIGRAAELVNGTVLKPGETFSLNGVVGERTRENGFTEGYIISDGIIVPDLGGGVSQLATTTFNAMFFAGLEDVEHKTHSFYIDRYPVGREATVAWGAVDLRFRNDTPYGVLVSAHVTPSTPATSGVVTVSMYSTKYWDITSRTGERYNLTQPKVRKIDAVRCHPATGWGGFDIDVWRYFHPVGSTEVERTERFHTRYIPSDTVICTNPDAYDPVG